MRGHLRKRGPSWQVLVDAGRDPITGKRRQVSRNVRGTKKQAEEVLARMLVEAGAGAHSGTSNATVSELVEAWFELARPDLSPSTIQTTRWFIDLYVRDRIGTVPLRRLSVAKLDRYYAELRKGGGANGKALSPRTVRRVHNIVRRALEQGLRWGWIGANPAAHASPPKLQRREPTPPTPADVQRLLDAAEADDPDFAMFLRVAAATGARRGELCGLRWARLDLDGGAVLIDRSVVRTDNGTVEKDTKTHQARRIALDGSTVAMLRQHRERAAMRARECGVSLADDAYVFSYEPDGGKPWAPLTVSQRFGRLRDRLDLQGVRLHDLRHYVATRLIAGGVSIRTVSGRLGHANAATTLGVYSHYVDATDQDAADLLGALLDDS